MPYGTLCVVQFCNLISTFSDSQTELEEVFFFFLKETLEQTESEQAVEKS